MDIRGITFAPFEGRGRLGSKEAHESLRLMKERTNSNYVLFAPQIVQENAQSTVIDYRSDATSSDEELKEIIEYAHELGYKVILKPTVNCKNGTWRAHISFFDEDVVCEPKWSEWFAAYTEAQLHFAALAEEMKCEIFIPGCEMVMSEHREAEWRKLIADLREVYHGPITYNTDKYQEHNVKWWDCLDMISSSGYYPIDDWERQLDRIEAVVKKYNKPFFFAETGCMSAEGSPKIPNNWELAGEYSGEAQADWYREMFRACKSRDWVKGTVLWSWTDRLYTEEEKAGRRDYDLYLKPAEKVVSENYMEGK